MNNQKGKLKQRLWIEEDMKEDETYNQCRIRIIFHVIQQCIFDVLQKYYPEWAVNKDQRAEYIVDRCLAHDEVNMDFIDKNDIEQIKEIIKILA